MTRKKPAGLWDRTFRAQHHGTMWTGTGGPSKIEISMKGSVSPSRRSRDAWNSVNGMIVRKEKGQIEYRTLASQILNVDLLRLHQIAFVEIACTFSVLWLDPLLHCCILIKSYLSIVSESLHFTTESARLCQLVLNVAWFSFSYMCGICLVTRSHSLI
jgi:hypothetical protein